MADLYIMVHMSYCQYSAYQGTIIRVDIGALLIVEYSP